MLQRILRLAVIDDDPEDVKLLRRSLEKISGLEFTLTEFSGREGGSPGWEGSNVDILFSGLFAGRPYMPGHS
jgi:hypothetical protein